MAFELKMPQLGLTMEEGTVSKWVKHEGDSVKAGDVVAEITTDKLTNELTSEVDGTLLKIVAQEGDDIPVKGTLAWIGQPGEQVGETTAPAVSAASAAPSAEPAAALASAPAASPAAGGKRIRISPLARKIAGQMGVDYTVLTGTGPSGRMAAAEAAPKAAAPAPADRKIAAPAAVSGTAFPVKNLELMEGDTVEKLTGMRKVVAQRMYTSAVEIPTVTQTVKVDVTALLAFRKKLKEEGHAFSVNDFVLKAVAKALRRHPEILVSLDGEQIIRRAHVIKPNYTEACFLAGVSCDKNVIPDEGRIDYLLDYLGQSTERVITTSIPRGHDTYCNISLDKRTGEKEIVSFPYIPFTTYGTGDIFSSIVMAGTLKNIPLAQTMRIATAFLQKAIEATAKAGTSPLEGILFENMLPELTETMERAVTGNE